MIGGGKFGNGAMTGAFSRLFNDEAHRHLTRADGPIPSGRYYDNPEEAGVAALSAGHAEAKRFNHQWEFGGEIIETSVDGMRKYTYTLPRTDMRATEFDPYADLPGQIGDYHTHPGTTSFSTKDLKYFRGTAEGRTRWGFVVDRRGVMYQHPPTTHEISRMQGLAR